MFQIDLNKFLWLKKLKTLWCGHILLLILTKKKLLESFLKKICKKQSKIGLELKKQGKENEIKYMFSCKSWIDKKETI